MKEGSVEASVQQALRRSLVVVVIRMACTKCDAQRGGKSMKHFIRLVDRPPHPLLPPILPPPLACFLSTNHSHLPFPPTSPAPRKQGRLASNARRFEATKKRKQAKHPPRVRLFSSSHSLILPVPAVHHESAFSSASPLLLSCHITSHASRF